jgi:hypothetical protein
MTKNRKEADLKQLLRFVDGVEKKNIKLNLQKKRPHEPNKLLLMFDLATQNIATQDEAEEAQIYRAAGYSVDYLAADRNELYNLILDQLADVSQENSGELQAYRAMSRLIVLFDKKLFDQAEKQALKAKKLTLQYELFGATIEILKYQQRIQNFLGRLDLALVLLNEQATYWQKHADINTFMTLHYRSAQLRIQLAKARNPAQVNAFELIIKNALLQNIDFSLGFYRSFHQLETFCNYYFVQDQPQTELYYNQQLLALYDYYPHFRKDQPLNFLVISTRILAIRRRLFPDQFINDLATYRGLGDSLQKQKIQAESMIFIFSYNYELDTYLRQQQWANALALLPDMQTKLKKYGSEVDEEFRLTCYYRFAYTYFFSGDYQSALDFLSLVLQDFNSNLRPDVYHVAQIFNIIIHYELGNQKLMLHLVQTTKYSLKKEGVLYQTERVVIRYLSRLAQLRSKKSVPQTFDNLAADLIVLLTDDYEKHVFSVFDFIAWANTHKTQI